MLGRGVVDWCELIFTADRSGHESEVSGARESCVRAGRGVVTRVRGGPEMIRAEGFRSRGVQTIVPSDGDEGVREFQCCNRSSEFRLAVN